MSKHWWYFTDTHKTKGSKLKYFKLELVKLQSTGQAASFVSKVLLEHIKGHSLTYCL